MLMKFYHKQRGIGLLELMLSLAIIAILLVMATRYYVITSRSQQTNQTAELYNSIIAAAQNYASGSNFSGITGANLINMGLIAKPDQNAGGTEIVNVWGKTVAVSPSTDGNDATISSTVADWACLSLERKFGDVYGASCKSGVFEITIAKGIKTNQ